ncbi:AraC family transcriptional regulator [Streptomyces sp. V4-01]|uniref:AraC family transcriptional regulator n=1 Tax=Actinacidiphila polyblastidii TaxID=3110430 RepID=A0ABU7P3T5_9ACTN|nr:AraC family transcriptional regulator [Streptomyces sp. V4-01]
MCHPSWGAARAAAQRLSDLARLRRVRDLIDREYAKPLDVEALARAADMPAGRLSRQFRLAYGRSPYAYLTARRVERAAALLRGGGFVAADVWRSVGCSSPDVFRARFTELVGMPPDAYRRLVREAAAGTPPPPAVRPARRPAVPIRNREASAAAPRLA